MSLDCNECVWFKNKCTLPSPHCPNKDMMDKCYKQGGSDYIDEYNRELKAYLRRFSVGSVGDKDFDYVAEKLKEKINGQS